ncbi:hypothetical protein L1999_12535 [Neobacillus drentensis]|uniref:hypothetical protein n=1 Tax=Neobacillus drentensis TaxID=220684 RepID=UPI001F28E13F|nr:hypothetical protein [Neobacillus drentensis]ULT59297.1 hypothetical protein L1999_12535 [Neobacillus drentensis]
MSLKNQRLINITMILLSCLPIPFIGRRSLKRFLPAAIFIIIFEVLNVHIARKRKWWVTYKKSNSFLRFEFPMIVGPFFVSTLWILKSTYGNFKKFILLNASINTFFAFVITKVTEKLKLAKLIRLNQFQFFLYLFYKAFILYGFQYLIDRKRRYKW